MINVNELTKFAPKVKQYLFIRLLFVILLTSVAFLLFGSNNFFVTFLNVVLIVGLPYYIYISLMYNSYSFLVSENDITINSGIFIKKSKMIPFNMIQNINRTQGMLMRVFRISNLDIWTSSPSQINIKKGETSNSPDGSLVLTSDDADWLQRFITYKPENIDKNLR